ncbi:MULTISPECIES: tripartite tricarboxylate transporter permease [Paraburkholderia]|uniref:Tripartite tricarboxylate transporter permease n=1 Tax=Paraburkholderia madseniana TaxID=2599607 RepID=A0AAP5BNR3_9BURK|nr:MULTISPECIES: tripartite tricarboxylate transporter permease [Paraburkholderia]MCX4152049.1 tripartite tricarboxylate transporter permease [Paraburkholderia madseniana]MCX4175626.1 tripartite tricarboxylate transporter permease [Paraburkholderia madseniana]MDN7154977.1 tripartite tricarboxylate transporter permease [Paraburkholderia sp. WS6]MDQ6413860.1 tripartite tricarboxylate transporter permease [Paraburkholderia madseniana]MDQ6463622.1 tripartite tricarboxylate transporter permease [Pa
MEVLHNLSFGFEHALTWQNLMFCALGCTVGTLVGLLPGLGPLATISLLLPLTYSIPTTGALIMLAGIYYGAQYGDSVSAITMKIPHASSIVACIDGYQMTLKGKTGLALFTAGVSSFIGGTVGIVVLSFLAPSLGEVAFLFGPADYCALMLVGFVCVSFVTTGSLLNGMAMCLIGVLLGQIGTDVTSGVQRFTFDLPFLADGVGLVSVALGCFGIAEITKNLDAHEERSPFNGKIHLIPSWAEFKRIIPSALRGSAIGSFLGILPGGGPVIAQFVAYAVDKKVSKYKDEIGSGAIEGVAGQAAADEAAARTSFIPLMSIGIPENPVMALMMAAFIIKGIQPGPNMIAGHPDLFWGLVASMWIGNCFLITLNVPLVRYWLSVFKIPYNVLFPAILFFCCIGTYSINNNLDDIYITAAFGLLGYVFMRLDMDPAPLMLGFILGPMLEENFRRAMLLSRGHFSAFVTRPISGTLLALIGLFVAWQVLTFFLKSGEATRKTKPT